MSLWGINGADEVLNGPWFSGREENGPTLGDLRKGQHQPSKPGTIKMRPLASSASAEPTVTVPLAVLDEAYIILASWSEVGTVPEAWRGRMRAACLSLYQLGAGHD